MHLKTTATINVQSSKKWSSLKHHMEHDPNVNHSNKDIDQSLTKYNVHGVIAHRDKILKQHYGRFIRTCLDTLTFDLILVKLDQKQEFLIHEKLCTPL